MSHFGLPGQATVDLRITWPGSAGSHQVQDLTGVAVGPSILAEEPVPPAAVEPGGSANPVMGHGTLWRATPNPSHGRVDLSWNRPGQRAEDLQILDVAGKLVRRLRGADPQAGTGHAIWDGFGDDGRVAPAGLYLARMEGTAGTVRVLLVR